MMPVFQIRTKESSSFAYAAGEHNLPHAEKFLHPKELTRTLDFWKSQAGDSGIVFDPDQGTKYPDFLSWSGVNFFVSKRVIDSLVSAEIQCFKFYLMPIASERPRRLKDIDPPNYFVLVANPGIRVDFPPLVAYKDSWNGAPMFSGIGEVRPRITLCTPEIIDLAKKDKWTNFDYNEVIVK